MNIYEESGVSTIINAEGTCTVLRGSKMSKKSLEEGESEIIINCLLRLSI